MSEGTEVGFQSHLMRLCAVCAVCVCVCMRVNLHLPEAQTQGLSHETPQQHYRQEVGARSDEASDVLAITSSASTPLLCPPHVVWDLSTV